MGQQTAFARATTRLPNTKPILRQFQDAMRLAVNRPEPDGRKRIIHLAERLSDLAMAGDVAAMREVMYCLDGRPGISGADDGQVSLSFVVRLPQMLDAPAWEAMTASRPARIVDVKDAETHAHAQSAGDLELAAVEPLAVELAADPLAVEPLG